MCWNKKTYFCFSWRFYSWALLACTMSLLSLNGQLQAVEKKSAKLSIKWEKRYLTISGKHLPGEIKIHYLEAYCRPGSTDRDWHKTVIPHQSQKVKADKQADKNGQVIRLVDTLQDGVVVKHEITASDDAITFRLVANNPTKKESKAHWAQPCIRVDRFMGVSNKDARALHPKYIKNCFIFLNGKQALLPTKPWAMKARYIPGQVYCPKGVDRNDVNPRPLSKLVPSNGLIGCYSADKKQIMAVAWQPYQELFQGVICCIHSDFRLGGLKPGETKKILGKIYIMDADIDKLLKRYQKDFSQSSKQQSSASSPK